MSEKKACDLITLDKLDKAARADLQTDRQAKNRTDRKTQTDEEALRRVWSIGVAVR